MAVIMKDGHRINEATGCVPGCPACTADMERHELRQTQLTLEQRVAKLEQLIEKLTEVFAPKKQEKKKPDPFRLRWED